MKQLHCFLKAHPTGKKPCKPSSISRGHFKHYRTLCPGVQLLPWLGWKRSWDPGAEHQLSLGSLQAGRGQERPPATAAKSHSYISHPAGGAGPTQPCCVPEMEKRQPGQEQGSRRHRVLLGTLPSLEPSHTWWGHSTAKPEPTQLLWGHHQHRQSCFGPNVCQWHKLNTSLPWP